MSIGAINITSSSKRLILLYTTYVINYFINYIIARPIVDAIAIVVTTIVAIAIATTIAIATVIIYLRELPSRRFTNAYTP